VLKEREGSANNLLSKREATPKGDREGSRPREELKGEKSRMTRQILKRMLSEHLSQLKKSETSFSGEDKGRPKPVK
jgi:hypothetical protein